MPKQAKLLSTRHFVFSYDERKHHRNLLESNTENTRTIPARAVPVRNFRSFFLKGLCPKSRQLEAPGILISMPEPA